MTLIQDMASLKGIEGRSVSSLLDQPWRRLLCRVEEIILLLVFLSYP
jgi:hypothetical protein